MKEMKHTCKNCGHSTFCPEVKFPAQYRCGNPEVKDGPTWHSPEDTCGSWMHDDTFAQIRWGQWNTIPETEEENDGEQEDHD